MAILVALVILGAAAGWLWWAGALEGLADRLKDGLAVFYPSRPLSRRALPRKLLRAAARTVTVGVSGTALLPTRIEIRVNPDDVAPFADSLDWLGQDVATALRKRATDAGWMVPAGPEIVVIPDEDRPLRVPRATGRIGALRPDDLRSLRTGESPVVPEPEPELDAAGAGAAGPGADAAPSQRDSLPTGYTGSAPTQASNTRSMPPAAGSTSVARAPGRGPAAVPGSPAAGAPGPERPTMAPTGRSTRVAPSPAAPETGHTAPTAATAAMRTLHLRLVSGQAAEADLSALLTGEQAPLVLGRSRQADLRVRDRHVSGRHCTFSLKADDGALTVEDLQSTNGTFVGGQKVRRATLRPGAVLRVGDSSWRVALDGVTTDPGLAS